MALLGVLEHSFENEVYSAKQYLLHNFDKPHQDPFSGVENVPDFFPGFDMDSKFA